MEANQNKYIWALFGMAVVVGTIYYFSDKPKGVNGLPDKKLPGKSLAASQVLQLMDKDHDYPQALRMVVREKTTGMSANKSKQYKRKLEKELNRYI